MTEPPAEPPLTENRTADLSQAMMSDAGLGDAALRTRRYASPSEQWEQERRRQRLLMLAVRTLFLVLLVTASLLPFVGSVSEIEGDFSFWDYAIPFLGTFLFGAIVVAIDVAIPTKRLGSVFGIYLGIIAG